MLGKHGKGKTALLALSALLALGTSTIRASEDDQGADEGRSLIRYLAARTVVMLLGEPNPPSQQQGTGGTVVTKPGVPNPPPNPSGPSSPGVPGAPSALTLSAPTPGGPPPSESPEPATMITAMIGLGIGGAALLRRRLRRA